MMKSMWIVIVVILAIGVGSFVSLKILNTESASMTKDLNAIEKNIKDNNWKEATRLYQRFDKEWESTQKTWCILIDHLEIDSVNISLAEFKSYLESHEEKEALSRLSVLKAVIQHIPDREAFRLKNVL